MKKRTLVWLILVGCWCGFLALPIEAQSQSLNGHISALVGAKIYPSPTDKPILNGVVLIQDGKIMAVGDRKKIKLPKRTQLLDCTGLILMAGFWNSHVHLSTPELMDAEHLPNPKIEKQLEEMLTRYGFTTVVDIGSFLENTTLIRQKITSGDIPGPKILTTGGPLYPQNGTPFYLKPFFQKLGVTPPEVGTSEQALALVKERFDGGADAIKIFSASPVGRGKTVSMSLATIQAITTNAHQRGKLVLAHPQSAEGINAAIDGGVDILAHTAPETGVWGTSLVEKMKKTGLALIPTLKLWHVGLIMEGTPPEIALKFQRAGVEQLRAYSKAGGQILFGTDVGYIQDFDTTEEFEQMHEAGMTFQQILAALTTTPANRFGLASKTGRIAKGMDADFVVLTKDPAVDVKGFSNVKYTIREGKIIFHR